MKIFGLCTSTTRISNLSFEKKALVREGQKIFDEVLLIDTRNMAYQFLRGSDRPIIQLGERDISDLSALYVGSTKNREASTAILVHTLSHNGCRINDPVSRFSVGFASKLLSTFRRFERGSGSSSFLAFNKRNAERLLQQIDEKKYFPLIHKPIRGSKGKGVHRINSLGEAQDFCEAFFQKRSNPDIPLFLQTFVNFTREFRVMVYDYEVIGMVEKIKAEGAVAANAAQGGAFKAVHDERLKKFVIDQTRSKGLFGFDVAIDEEEQFHVIESNRAPLWETFQEATGINVAGEILTRMF